VTTVDVGGSMEAVGKILLCRKHSGIQKCIAETGSAPKPDARGVELMKQLRYVISFPRLKRAVEHQSKLD